MTGDGFLGLPSSSQIGSTRCCLSRQRIKSLWRLHQKPLGLRRDAQSSIGQRSDHAAAPVVEVLREAERADTVEERAALFAKTGAWAIDDETRAVAEAARKRNVPYCAIRAVSDDASMTLPLAARQALGPDGNLNLGAFLAALASNPLQVVDLVKIAGDFGKALDSLRRAATVLT